jgi:hypothetical protein
MQSSQVYYRPDSIKRLNNAPGQTIGTVTIAYHNGKIAIKNKKGGFDDYVYDEVGMYGHLGMIPVKKEGKWGFHSYHQEMFDPINCNYDSVKVFDYNERRAEALINGVWKKINLWGKEVVDVDEKLDTLNQPRKYSHASTIIYIDTVIYTSKHVVVGKLNTSYVFIKEDGQVNYFNHVIVQNRKWLRESPFFWVDSAGFYGVRDMYGYDLFPCIYEDKIVENMYMERFALKKDGKYAVSTGRGVKSSSDFVFDDVDLHTEPHQTAIVKMGATYSFLNNGTFKPYNGKFDEIRRSLGDSYACRIGGVFQFYNYKGELKSEKEYDDIYFKGGAWIVEKNGKFGLVDNYVKNECLPVTYQTIEVAPSSAYVLAKKDNTWQLHNIHGKKLWNDTILDFEFSGNDIIITTARKEKLCLSCTMSNCKKQIPISFDEIVPFMDGFIIRFGNQYGLIIGNNWVIPMSEGLIKYDEKRDELILDKEEVKLKLMHPYKSQVGSLRSIFIKPQRNNLIEEPSH